MAVVERNSVGSSRAPHRTFRWPRQHSAGICRDGAKHVILPGIIQEHLLAAGREGGETVEGRRESDRENGESIPGPALPAQALM